MSAKKAKQIRRNVRYVQEALNDGITLAHGYINYEVIEDEQTQEESHQAAHSFAVEVRDFVLGRMEEDANITGEIAAMATLEQGHRFADLVLSLDSQVKAAKLRAVNIALSST